MKNGFSLLELIFAIVVIGIISSVAVPKYMDTKNSALASTIQRDIVTASTSIQSYYLLNREIVEISEMVILNANNWEKSGTDTMVFEDGSKPCVTLKATQSAGIEITLSDNDGGTCAAIKALGIKTETIDLI